MVSDLEMAQIKESAKQRRSGDPTPYRPEEVYPDEYPNGVYERDGYPEEPYYGGDYSTDQYSQNKYFPETVDDEVEDDDDYDYRDNPKMEKITAVLAIFAGLIILVVLILIVMRVLDRFKAPTDRQDSTTVVTESTSETASSTKNSAVEEGVSVKMPVVQGVDADDAVTTLRNLYLTPRLEYEDSDQVPMGIVIRASAQPGDMLAEGTEVILTISAGTESIPVPQVVGKSYDEASRELTASGFLVNKTDEYSQEVPKDNVILQDPAGGDTAPDGSVITLHVSIGPEDTRVQVPNVIGMTEADGKAAITARGLQVSSVSSVFHTEITAGFICYQSYSADSYLEPGTGIDIRVSKGPEAVAYKYEEDITAPTVTEAPDYVAGAKVHIKLATDDGVVLKDTTVTTFPEPARFYGITTASGVITFTYQVTIPGDTTTGEDGQTITAPSTTEERSFTRKVEFTRE
jgi:serine/threonine-protein kinase